MLYRFQSKATGDVVMLEANGRRMLEIIGKDPGATGIILPAQMPAAIAALEAAVQREEAAHQAAQAEARAAGKPEPRVEGVSLRQRAHPLLDMLRRCAAADKEIVWGV